MVAKAITAPRFSGAQPPEKFNLARHCLQESARATPDKTALIIDRGELQTATYSELEEQVLRIAGGFGRHGFAPKAKIFIRMGNSLNYALVFLGAIAAGLVPVPASSMLTKPEVQDIVTDCSACALVNDGSLETPDLPDSVAVLDPWTLIGAAPVDYADTHRDDPAYLIYTSGTSGHAKGVLHAQRALWGRRPMYQGWYGLNADDVVMHTGAFNWTYTLGTGLCDPWVNGATAVIYTGKPDVTVWPRLARRHRVTIMASVPALYRRIMKYCDLTPTSFGALRHGLITSEAAPVNLIANWRQATGLELYEALGMSEISTYISMCPGMAVRAGSPGKPQPGRAVAILPADGGDTPLARGEEGLIAVHRSDPAMMLGYWRRPGEERAAMRGDWFTGGDLGAMDEDGYIWFSGRNDDVLTTFGYRVSPLEIENCLTGHPLVAEAAAGEITVGDGVSIIAAFVVAKAGAALDAMNLKAYAGERLAAYKAPREIYLVDRLPRTANGKVIRKALHTLL